MTHRLPFIALVACAALAGCNQSDHTLTEKDPYDPEASATSNAAEVKLPPAIAASITYRCKDNSLLYVDWYSDGSARVKASQSELGVAVPAPAEGATSELGAAQGQTISWQGKNCHV